MTHPIPQQYLSDSLFLLIGRNLLPNYVAAHLLLKAEGKIYLVHSEASRAAAENLGATLIREGFSTPQRLPISSGHPDSIYGGVSNAVRQALSQGSVGLNYTGGTKVMAVHAHRAAGRAARAEDQPVVLSYLDANDRHMVIDPLGTAVQQRFAVLLTVRPSLHTLLRLHGIPLAPWAPLRDAFLPETAGELVGIHSTEEGCRAWSDWCRNLRKNPGRFLSTGALRKARLPESGALTAVTEAVRQELDLSPGPIELGDVVGFSPWSGLRAKKSMEEIAAWFDGKWLEHYTFLQLIAIAGTQNLHPLGLGMGLRTDQYRSPFDFEVDVGAMRGYQLFAIACTRSMYQSRCTSKLLEAYIRGSQLGGEEARTGLVCCSPVPQVVQQQMEDAWGIKKRVRVFGRDDLGSLAEKLAEWIESTP